MHIQLDFRQIHCVFVKFVERGTKSLAKVKAREGQFRVPTTKALYFS